MHQNSQRETFSCSLGGKVTSTTCNNYQLKYSFFVLLCRTIWHLQTFQSNSSNPLSLSLFLSSQHAHRIRYSHKWRTSYYIAEYIFIFHPFLSSVERELHEKPCANRQKNMWINLSRHRWSHEHTHNFAVHACHFIGCESFRCHTDGVKEMICDGLWCDLFVGHFFALSFAAMTMLNYLNCQKNDTWFCSKFATKIRKGAARNK